MGVVGKGFQKGKPEEGEALLTVVPFVKEAAIMKRSIGGAVYCVVSSERVLALSNTRCSLRCATLLPTRRTFLSRG